MIVYRKAAPLRIKRSAVPEPPWWFATAVAPYGPRRATPLAIDYVELRATGHERAEVAVTADVRDTLERMATRIEAPVLVDAAERAEVVFRRGEQTLDLLREWSVPATLLISTEGGEAPAADMTVIAAWPPTIAALRSLATALRGRHWGLAVPVMFPVTTELALLDQLCRIAAEHEATFFAAVGVDIDATGKQAIARSLTLADDEETFQQLFHADLEPLHTSTERHIAALAAGAGLADFVVPPRWEEKTNWNAAVLLTLTAARMLAMGTDTELAGTLARSARLVAELEKPLARIAEAASISIVESLDEISVDILTEWLESGRSPFVDRVNERWRLRRDAGL